MQVMTVQDNATIARMVYDAFNSLDFDRALEQVSNDIEIEVHALPMTFQGLEGFRAMMDFYKKMAPNGTVEVLRQLVGEDGVANECVYRGTNTGPVTMPDGSEIPPTGKSFEISFCEVWRFRNGKVGRLDNYADNLQLLQQLGLAGQ
jgi:steroid delta-isomerase-like uncharacterized protein